jgi:hypothetical protein
MSVKSAEVCMSNMLLLRDMASMKEDGKQRISSDESILDPGYVSMAVRHPPRIRIILSD